MPLRASFQVRGADHLALVVDGGRLTVSSPEGAEITHSSIFLPNEGMLRRARCGVGEGKSSHLAVFVYGYREGITASPPTWPRLFMADAKLSFPPRVPRGVT